MTWTRTGFSQGQGTEEHKLGRVILRRIEKKSTVELADILVVEEGFWDSSKSKIYQKNNKIIIPADEVAEYFMKNFPEVIL